MSRSGRPQVPLRAEEPTGPAIARVLRALLEVMDANLPGAVAGLEPECLHDYRVTVRRTRAVQRQIKHAFDPEHLKELRAEFKWLQQATGPARDLDVYVAGFDSLRDLIDERLRGDLEPLRLVLAARRAAAHQQLAQDLGSERARSLRGEWEAALDGLSRGPDADRPYTARPIGEVASKRIRKVYRRMVKMGGAITAESPAAELHDLRKQGKELRYLLELFASPMDDPAVVKPLIKKLKALQDVLGRHQDREVQVTLLRSLAGEVDAQPGGAAALLATGALVERLEDDAAEMRERFAGVFAGFASQRQREIVRRTW